METVPLHYASDEPARKSEDEQRVYNVVKDEKEEMSVMEHSHKDSIAFEPRSALAASQMRTAAPVEKSSGQCAYSVVSWNKKTKASGCLPGGPVAEKLPVPSPVCQTQGPPTLPKQNMLLRQPLDKPLPPIEIAAARYEIFTVSSKCPTAETHTPTMPAA